MINLDHPTLPLIKEALPEAKLFATEFRGQTTLIVERDVLHGLLKFLRDDERTRYDLLSDIAGIDYLRYPKPKDAPEDTHWQRTSERIVTSAMALIWGVMLQDTDRFNV